MSSLPFDKTAAGRLYRVRVAFTRAACLHAVGDSRTKTRISG
jgi:hypothetical protein